MWREHNKQAKLSTMLCREKLKDMYTGFCKEYPIVTIEDPFDQDDWSSSPDKHLWNSVTDRFLPHLVWKQQLQHTQVAACGFI